MHLVDGQTCSANIGDSNERAMRTAGSAAAGRRPRQQPVERECCEEDGGWVIRRAGCGGAASPHSGTLHVTQSRSSEHGEATCARRFLPSPPCGRYPPVWHVGVAERVLLTPTERAPKQQQESGRALRAAEQRRHTHTRRPVGSVLTRRAKCTDLAHKAAHTPAHLCSRPPSPSSGI